MISPQIRCWGFRASRRRIGAASLRCDSGGTSSSTGRSDPERHALSYTEGTPAPAHKDLAQNSAPFSHRECRRRYGGTLVAASCQQRLAGIVTAYVCCPETDMPVPYCCTSLPDANRVQNSALFFADSLLPCALLAVVDRRCVDMGAATIFRGIACSQMRLLHTCVRAHMNVSVCACL